MKHSRDQLLWASSLQLQDLCHYAVFTGDGPERVIFLAPDGSLKPVPDSITSRSVKAWTADEAMHCLIPGCGPFQVARNNGTKRDTFAHPRGATHTATEIESAGHKAGKARLAAWMKAELGTNLAAIQIDDGFERVGDEVRRPDILAVLVDDRKIVVEYQHSPGRRADIEERTRFYVENGYALWWFWGPGKRNCRDFAPSDPDAGMRSTARRNDGQQALAEFNRTFHWFHPGEERVATPYHVGHRLYERKGELWTDADPALLHRWYPGHLGKRPEMLIDTVALSECSIDLSPTIPEFVTPGVRRFRSGYQREASLREAARARHVSAGRSMPPPPPEAIAPTASTALMLDSASADRVTGCTPAALDPSTQGHRDSPIASPPVITPWFLNEVTDTPTAHRTMPISGESPDAAEILQPAQVSRCSKRTWSRRVLDFFGLGASPWH